MKDGADPMREKIERPVASDTPKGLGRREVLQALLGAAGAGFAIPALAQTHPIRAHLADPAGVARADARASGAVTTPEFLDAHQMATLVSLSEHIVPGSTSARVAPFVDQLLAVDTHANQRQFLNALGAVEGEALARYQHPWTSLTESQQVELLTALSSTASAQAPPHFWARGEAVIVPAPPPNARPTARDHFDELKGWIVGAYYSSEIGMRELGWKGQTFFASFPGCEHPDGHR